MSALQADPYQKFDLCCSIQGQMRFVLSKNQYYDRQYNFQLLAPQRERWKNGPFGQPALDKT